MNLSATISGLQEALKFTPENYPLKKMLGDALFEAQRFNESEVIFHQLVVSNSENLDYKYSLSCCYTKNNKISASQIVLEELADKKYQNAAFNILYSKYLIESKKYELASEYYQNAIDLDENLIDVDLENVFKKHILKPTNEQETVVLYSNESEIQSFKPDFQGLEKPKITFEDVGGMVQVKDEISMKIIFPLTHPEIYKSYGKKIGGGILLYGPPGCGKTMIARATAGQINASFISVGINEILDMYLGSSEKNIHAVFNAARQNTPCVLFFDEVDALGANRNDLKQNWFKTVINQFLDELDGVKYSNEGILILAATNAPWHMDSAFKRPGRFDRQIFVSPPDAEARKKIFSLHLAEKPTEKINIEDLVKLTYNYSGADIKAVIDTAIESKLFESMKKGAAIPISTNDLKNAIQKVRPSTIEWLETARNYATYSNESGQYNDILSYFKSK